MEIDYSQCFSFAKMSFWVFRVRTSDWEANLSTEQLRLMVLLREQTVPNWQSGIWPGNLSALSWATAASDDPDNYSEQRDLYNCMFKSHQVHHQQIKQF